MQSADLSLSFSHGRSSNRIERRAGRSLDPLTESPVSQLDNKGAEVAGSSPVARLPTTHFSGRVRGRVPTAGAQLRQLGEIDRQPPRPVPGQQLGRRAPTGLVLEIEIRGRLAGGVADDEARVVVLLDRPKR